VAHQSLQLKDEDAPISFTVTKMHAEVARKWAEPQLELPGCALAAAIWRRCGHGATALRMRELTQVIGVDRRTVERWRTWWRDSFTATPFWKVARAAFMPPVDPSRLPAALIERFAGDDADRLVALLRFMGPITGGRMHAR
jgi:hypothetical protein